MSKFMDNLLPISMLNLNSAKKKIHWVEIYEVFNGHVHDVWTLLCIMRLLVKTSSKFFLDGTEAILTSF